jgi:CRP-like cAMP-binding protein
MLGAARSAGRVRAVIPGDATVDEAGRIADREDAGVGHRHRVAIESSGSKRPLPAFDALRHNPLFKGIDERLLQDLTQVSRFERYRSRTLVRRVGDMPRHLMLVVTGVLEYSRTNAAGRRSTIRYLGAGELCDVIPALDGRGCPFDVRTCGETSAVLIPIGAFRTLLGEAHELLYRVSLILCDRNRYSYELVDQLGNLSLRQRLARALLDLASAFDRLDEGRRPVEIHISQEDLAAMLSASRQRVNAELRWFVSEGMLSTRYSRITFEDHARLAAFASCTTERLAVSGCRHAPRGAPRSPNGSCPATWIESSPT